MDFQEWKARYERTGAELRELLLKLSDAADPKETPTRSQGEELETLNLPRVTPAEEASQSPSGQTQNN